MSRYVIWTSDEHLEVFVGFDEGIDGFFLTIADSRTCTGERGSYLFHNLDHHPKPEMTLEEVRMTLAHFRVALPGDLAQQLASDGGRDYSASAGDSSEPDPALRVLGWQSAV